MYIERCKHGSEGGLYKPTIEIWQGGTFLPYSFITMNKTGWQRHSYAASCGVSSRVIDQMLKDNPHIEMVYLGYDNDEAGRTAAHRISGKLFTQGIQSELLVPTRKDWNEDLLFSDRETEVENPCQVLRL